MKKPEYYPNAIAPEQLTGKRFDTLAADAPVYVHPTNEYDDFDVYVLSDRKVRVRKSTEITSMEANPKNVIGRVGLMRVMLIAEDGSPLSGVVADFSYLNEPLIEYPAEAPDDQEDMNDWVEEQKGSVEVNAFIVKDGDEVSYYGAEKFYPGLDYLRRNGRAIHKAHLREQRKKELAQQKAKKDSKKTKQHTKK